MFDPSNIFFIEIDNLLKLNGILFLNTFLIKYTGVKKQKISWIEAANLFQKNYYLFDSLTLTYKFKNKINYAMWLSSANFFNCLSGILFLFFFDAIFDGDEPLWEPLEWSLIQTWLLFIFLFSWIAENLITSQFGSFTGRDKRVWFSWYKSMWWIEIFYIVTLGVTILLIITPFYFELTYASSYIMNFWNWFTKIFFFKTILLFYVLIAASLILQLQIKNVFFKKNTILIGFITVSLFVLFFIQFYICFFSYFTDNNWYAKNKSTDLIQLSHEPWKWSWDLENRDHFQYHNSRTVFWFKNDGPFAEAFFLINLLYFTSLFIVLIFWISLFKKTIALEVISFNFTLGVISTLKQFFFFFLLFYLFILTCIIVIFLKYPYEFLWVLDSQNILSHFKICVIH